MPPSMPGSAPNSRLFDFTDASIQGDPRWRKASPHFGAYAPYVVIALFALSIIEIVIGVVWITGITSLSNGYDSLSFAQVIQPLLIPALSFFNVIPSLHLHILARNNSPLMAAIFSGLLFLAFLGSAVTFIPPCIPFPRSTPSAPPSQTSGYRNTECPPGTKQSIWSAVVAMQFLSAAGYGVHMLMGVWVRRQHNAWRRAVEDGTVLEVIDEEEKRRREELARKRWREMGAVF